MPFRTLALYFGLPLLIAVVVWAQHPERWWLLPIGLFLGCVGALRAWFNYLHRRAFDPQTPEDVAKAPERQARGVAIVVYGLMAFGAILAAWALWDRFSG